MMFSLLNPLIVAMFLILDLIVLLQISRTRCENQDWSSNCFFNCSINVFICSCFVFIISIQHEQGFVFSFTFQYGSLYFLILHLPSASSLLCWEMISSARDDSLSAYLSLMKKHKVKLLEFFLPLSPSQEPSLPWMLSCPSQGVLPKMEYFIKLNFALILFHMMIHFFPVWKLNWIKPSRTFYQHMLS